MEELDKESWDSLSIKRNDDIDSLIINKNDSVQVTSDKTKKFLNKLKSIRYVASFKPNDGLIATKDDYQLISNFVKEHNKIEGRNTTLLPINTIRNFFDLGFHAALFKTNKGDIVGCIFTCDIKVIYQKCKNEECIEIGNTYDEKSDWTRIGCTTFLVVHKNFRNVGLAMALIKEAIDIGKTGTTEGFGPVLGGYHTINIPRGINSVKVPVWYRPINILESNKLGYPCNSATKFSTYKKLNLNYKRITSLNATTTLELFKELNKNKKFYFMPNLNDWRRWINNFHCYRVDNDTIFILHYVRFIPHEHEDESVLGWPMLILGDAIKACRSIIRIYKKKNVPLVMFHQLGDLTSEALTHINAIDAKHSNYLDFYNVGIKSELHEISLPII